MRKILLAAVLAAAALAAAAQQQSPQRNLFTVLQEKAHSRYSAWKAGKDPETAVYYCDDGKYDALTGIRSGQSSGWYQLIYYRNVTGHADLKAVRMIGYYAGDSDRVFKFWIEDMKGTSLYESPEYKYSTFPAAGERPRVVSVEARVKDAPEELIIKVRTDSSRDDGLFFVLIPNKTNVFSYEYRDAFTYKECKGSNYAIMPVFEN